MSSQIKAVLGGASVGFYFKDHSNVAEVLSLLTNCGVPAIDTARLYSGSEEAFGAHPELKSFDVDTKIPGGLIKGTATKDAVVADIEDSLKRLKIEQIDVLYIHCPDDTVDIRDTLAGIDAAHKKGYFKRFGLSNFTPEQVQEVYDVATEKGYIKPTVYQGNYSPIARHLDTILFPTLRKLGIAFYAYSPLAGGFLTKTPADIEAGEGRFNDETFLGLYNRLYNKPNLRAALVEWNAIAEAEGVSKAELANRWVGYNSALKPELGDAVIFGSSKLSHIEEQAGWLKKGGLSQSTVERIDKFWESIKADAPVDNAGVNKV